MNLPRDPVTASRIVLRMAKCHAADNLSALTPEQCAALELVDRAIMRLERLWKSRAKTKPLEIPAKIT